MPLGLVRAPPPSADLPIDDIWQQAKLDERFAPSLVRAASDYQGKKYLLPLT